MSAPNSACLEHGGQLQNLSQQYNIPMAQWLDLSTGISPISYPIPEIPPEIWQRLPEENSELIEIAKEYYRCQHILPISGSQAVIQLLPKLLSSQNNLPQQIHLPKIGYQEHNKAWLATGLPIRYYSDIKQLFELQTGDVVVMINPNNPTGELYSLADIKKLLARVKEQQGTLIVDEAFMDCTPEHSCIKLSVDPSLIVLRSTGKFFGLAGIRLGFVAAVPSWLTQLKAMLGPWHVNGPAQYIGHAALSDVNWQIIQRTRLSALRDALAALLLQHFNKQSQGTLLFQTIQTETAPQLFDALAQQGVYVRLCDEQNALRFGIPTTKQLAKLTVALERCNKK